MSDVESLKSENQKLREYISLISSEIEFVDRVNEIKKNYKDSSDLERIITPILDRIDKIQSEKSSLASELHLN